MISSAGLGYFCPFPTMFSEDVCFSASNTVCIREMVGNFFPFPTMFPKDVCFSASKTVCIREMVGYFFLFPQYFWKMSALSASNTNYWGRVSTEQNKSHVTMFAMVYFNPSPHTYNIVAKGEIAHHEQILLLAQCFQLYSITVLSFINRKLPYFGLNVFISRLLQICCMWEKVKAVCCL